MPASKIPSKQTVATGNLIKLIGHFRKKRKQFHFLKDFSKATHPSKSHFQEQLADVESPLKEVVKKLYTIQEQGFFFFEVLCWKIDYLAEGLEQGIKAKNPLTLANNARALVEHIATLSAVGRKIQRLDENLRGKQSEKQIHEELDRVLTYLQRAFYGKGGETDLKEERAIHINDSLKELKKEIKNIGELYGRLCEYVHPNYGSNRLVSTGELGRGLLNPPEEFNRELLDELRRICAYCFIYLEEQGQDHIWTPARLQITLDRCLVKGAKLANVFPKDGSKPTGDGKSKETALFFPSAKTHSEGMRMLYDYFEKKGIQPTGKHKVAEMTQDNIIDVIDTNKGKIWARIQTKF